MTKLQAIRKSITQEEMSKKKFECTCEHCKNACSSKPGWFMPGEIEKVAKYLNLSSKELFDKYLGVDWWAGEEDVFVLAPVIVGEQAGSEYPGDPRGECIFFNKDGLCDIHPVKPFECAELTCDGNVGSRHKEVADSWKTNQEQIVELLRREPEAKEFYGGGLFGSMFG